MSDNSLKAMPWVGLIAALALAAAMALLLPPQGDGATSDQPPLPVLTIGGDFELLNMQGESERLATHFGQPILLNFGFTTCPDVCPLVLARMAGVIKAIEQEGQSVLPVFVSFDPERDTPERLRNYLPYFHSSFVGYTGADDAIAAVAKRYGVVYLREETDSEMVYNFTHSDYVYLLDRQGRVRRLYGEDLTVEKLRDDLARLGE